MIKYKLIFLCFIIISLTLQAGEEREQFSLSMARKILDGCLHYADTNKLNMSISIFDIYGQLKAFAHMDGASVGSAKVSMWKGYSAAIYQFSTEETKKWNVPNAPDIATIAGGIPIRTLKGTTVGGIGVSGAPSSVDVLCAEAGLASAGLFAAKASTE